MKAAKSQLFGSMDKQTAEIEGIDMDDYEEQMTRNRINAQIDQLWNDSLASMK